MDGLYHSPPYAYLPQQHQQQDYHSYRPFHMEDNHHQHHPQHNNQVIDSGWSSSPHNHHLHQMPYGGGVGYYNNNNSVSNATTAQAATASMISSPRPKITSNLWEDEGTLCFQVDAKGICVARRQDNDMINGTKLLNVVGMSRGKRDGILKNEKGRVVVKVGAMHLKGVWIPFSRATELAEKFKILDVLYPLFVDEPSIYLGGPGTTTHSNEVILPSPSIAIKCNNMISSPLPAFNNNNGNRGTTTDDYDWDTRPYSLISGNSHHTSSPYDHHHHHQQVLHRNNSNLDLSTSSSPIPRSMNHHHNSDENDLYHLGQQPSYNNRGSFSSVSSHPSYLYPSLQQPQHYQHQQHHHHHRHHHHEDEASKTTTTAYDMYGAATTAATRSYTTTTTSSPYTTNNTLAAVATENKNGSAGSTTPSSWFSPETPTAVLFQQKDEATTCKKRKSSCELKTVKSIVVTSPPATKRVKVEEQD